MSGLPAVVITALVALVDVIKLLVSVAFAVEVDVDATPLMCVVFLALLRCRADDDGSTAVAALLWPLAFVLKIRCIMEVGGVGGVGDAADAAAAFGTRAGVDGDKALFRVTAPAPAFVDPVDDEERDRDDDESPTLIGAGDTDTDAGAAAGVVLSTLAAGAVASAKYLLMMAVSTFAVDRMGFVSSKRDINCLVDDRC